MVRGEIPIELGASWFSPKCVEAQQLSKFNLLSMLLFLRNKSVGQEQQVHGNF